MATNTNDRDEVIDIEAEPPPPHGAVGQQKKSVQRDLRAYLGFGSGSQAGPGAGSGAGAGSGKRTQLVRSPAKDDAPPGANGSPATKRQQGKPGH